MKEFKKYSPAIRIWHWLNAVSILGSLGTVVLRKTFLSYKANGDIIQSELAKINIEITTDAARQIGKAIRSPMWEMHYIFGFVLAGLFIVRIILNFMDRSFLPKAEFQKDASPERMKSLMYLTQYILIAVMAVTGGLMYFRESLGISKELVGSLKELHEITMYFFAFFVPVHIIGVFIAENRGQRGIVSNMIGGQEK